MENNSKTPLWYGKCGCGWIVTDYPFMSCTICGYIGCGSTEELEKAKKGGYLINWKIEKPQNVPDSEIRDCSVNIMSEFPEEEDWDDIYDDSWDDDEDFDDDYEEGWG